MATNPGELGCDGTASDDLAHARGGSPDSLSNDAVGDREVRHVIGGPVGGSWLVDHARESDMFWWND